MKSFILNGKTIEILELIDRRYELRTFINDELKTIDLIKDWLSDNREFQFTTSGSTGVPKAITLSRDQLQKSAQRTVDYFGIKQENTLLACLSSEMIAGAMMIIRAFAAACNLIIESPKANPLYNLPLGACIDFMAVTPNQMERILQESPMALHQVKIILIGGADIHPDLEHKLQSIKPNIFHSYAMTETISHVALRKVNGPHKSDVFRAIEKVSFSINDASCLIVQDDLLSIDLLETNDIVELIDETTFRWLGRRDNVIKNGVVKVQMEETEREIKKILTEQGLKGSLCLCAVPDTKLTNKIILLYETKTPFDSEKNLLKSMKVALPKYHAPREIIQVPQLFHTKSGKMDRIKIQDVYLRDFKK